MSAYDNREKIKKLRDYWFDDEMSLKFVDGIEKKLRAIANKEKLRDIQAIQDIVKDTQAKIHAIDTVLMYSEDMTELERKLLFREKKVYNFFLDRLDGKDLDQQFDRVGKLLDTEMKRVGLMKGDDE